MSRRVVMWVLTAPLLVAASLIAHQAAYLAVVPDATERAAELEASGHAYLEHVPLVLGVASVIAFGLLLLHAATGTEYAHSLRLERRLLASLPLLSFPVQETLERLFASGGTDLTFVSDPVFLLGFALQVPFALATLSLAHWLLRAAELVVRVLAPRLSLAGWTRVESRRDPGTAELVRIPVLASSQAGRAPPFVR